MNVRNSTKADGTSGDLEGSKLYLPLVSVANTIVEVHLNCLMALQWLQK